MSGRVRPSLPRRVLLRVLALATIGAAATVLVAWGSAIRVNPRRPTWHVPPTPRAFQVSMSRIDGVAASIYTVRVAYVLTGSWPSGSVREAATQSLQEAIEQYRSERIGPTWRSAHLFVADGTDRDPFLEHDERGWPKRALCCEWIDDPAATAVFAPPVVRGGIDVSGYRGARGRGALPLWVLWPGFLVDTAFWGGAAFLVWSAPGFVRRRVRRRRVRCVRCGYELAGVAVCPECGDAA